MRSILSVVFAGLVACIFGDPGSAAEAAKFKEKVLHSFGADPDGQEPYAGVIDVKGTLYGTTSVGGHTRFGGTVFAVDPKSGAETVLYFSDDQPGAGLINVKGTLYGTTQGYDGAPGTVFALNISTGIEKTLYIFCSQGNCADGYSPVAGLLYVKGALYGTTAGGGNLDCNDGFGCGTVFSIDPNTGEENTVYTFCSQQNCIDGASPSASLIDVNGTLYGTTRGGGTGGIAFSIDLKTGTEKTLYAFCSQQNCADGARPSASLLYMNGLLYGTTDAGGNTKCAVGEGCGTVFSLDPNKGTEKVLYTFCSLKHCADGATPDGSLIVVNGALYGVAFAGGSTGHTCNGGGCGTVFSIDPDTGAETVVHTFCTKANCVDGENPVAGLTFAKGRLYGTTVWGGTDRKDCGPGGCGTVFVIEKKR